MTPMSVAVEHDAHLSRPAGGAPLTLRGVRKSFGAKTVLNGVDLHVPTGQFLTIVGRSGGGKSTSCDSSPGSTNRPREGLNSKGYRRDGLVWRASCFRSRAFYLGRGSTRMSRSASVLLQTLHRL